MIFLKHANASIPAAEVHSSCLLGVKSRRSAGEDAVPCFPSGILLTLLETFDRPSHTLRLQRRPDITRAVLTSDKSTTISNKQPSQGVKPVYNLDELVILKIILLMTFDIHMNVL